MKTIAFAPLYNTEGKKDATGAFQPMARKFCSLHEGSVCLFDNHATDKRMREQVIAALTGVEKQLVAVAFFCHGYKRGLQCGFNNSNVLLLARAIMASAPANVIVSLYACDTGRNIDKNRRDDLEAFGGDGGFADRLRDSLCSCGGIDCRVDAHTTAGHTTANPNVRRFEGGGVSTAGPGGYYIVPCSSRYWKKWKAALRTDYALKFSFMSIEQIYDYLDVNNPDR